MKRKIIHIDMDAFYAAVEIRDNAELLGKPVIIGAMPNERGVVATCSYEARKYGVRSAMSITEAYRRCPHGVYMHPNFHKYTEASKQIHKIWETYTDLFEYISLDEGFLDVTRSEHLFGGAVNIGYEIKYRVKEEVGLTCSVGIGYSMMSAKLASEEKKPNGFFEIPTAEFLKDLIIDRSVRTIYGVGEKTAAALQSVGITTVRHIYERPHLVTGILGNQGFTIIELARGEDNRQVASGTEHKSLGKEITLQHDTDDIEYLKDIVILMAKKLSFELRLSKIYCRTITLKVTYSNMQTITRSKSGKPTNRGDELYETAVKLIDSIEKRSIRLIGISLSGFSDKVASQISLFDVATDLHKDKLDNATLALQKKYGSGIIKTGTELMAEKHMKNYT